VDLSKFKTSDWLKVGGGVVMLVAGFLSWYSYDVSFVSVSYTGFDFFFTGIIPWLLLVAVGVLTFLAVAGIFKLPSSIPAPLVFLAASALACTAGSAMGFKESGGDLNDLKDMNKIKGQFGGAATGGGTPPPPPPPPGMTPPPPPPPPPPAG